MLWRPGKSQIFTLWQNWKFFVSVTSAAACRDLRLLLNSRPIIVGKIVKILWGWSQYNQNNRWATQYNDVPQPDRSTCFVSPCKGGVVKIGYQPQYFDWGTVNPSIQLTGNNETIVLWMAIAQGFGLPSVQSSFWYNLRCFRITVVLFWCPRNRLSDEILLFNKASQ